MAAFDATFHYVDNRSLSGAVMPVARGSGAAGTTQLTTSSSAQTVQRDGADFTAPADGYVTVVATGAVRMAVGETAATGPAPVGHYIPSGVVVTVSVRAGETLSVIDA